MVIQLILPNGQACPAITNLQVKRTEQCKQVRLKCFSPSEIALPGTYVLKADDEVLSSGVLKFVSEPDSLGMRLLTISDDSSEDDGSELMNLTPCVFDKTIKFSEQTVPHLINITLQTDWLQQSAGVLDLGPKIAAQFPTGIINSLNTTFGECVHQTQKSGYTVLESSFTQIVPPSTGVLDVYPALGNVCVGETPSQIKRYWFKCAWRIAWEYEQKRVEKLSFTLPFSPIGDFEESLHIKADEVETLAGFKPSNATLGHLWGHIVRQALKGIKETLYDKYCPTVSCSVPFRVGATLHLGQPVAINCSTVTISGRVSAVNCACEEGNKQSAEVTISTCPEWLRAWQRTDHILQNIEETSSLEGLVESELSENSAIAEILVENDAGSQLEQLASKKFASMQDVNAFIDASPTRIFVRLRDLKTKRHLTHTLTGSLRAGPLRAGSHADLPADLRGGTL
ncbi:MAG: hypothetical protein LBF66_01875 [Holosporales bacterium]|jgi:hypothetical protein|nr:hypothetical protein [Holosporales bacterium]